MDTVVTIKATPQEFDLLRQAMRSLIAVLDEQTKDAPIQERQSLRAKELQAKDLLARMQ